MHHFRHTILLLLWLGCVPFAQAQTAFRYELLSLLPEDFAVCIVMHDLRGHADRWEKADWFKMVRQSPVGKALTEAPEFKQFQRWQGDLKKHFDLDWPTLRDDLLGDTLVLSYSPGPKSQPDDERGLFLLHAHKPDRLRSSIDRLNELQKNSGELKSLTELQHKGATYYRRVQGAKTQYYFVKDALLAFSTKEEILHAFLDRRASAKSDGAWARRFQKAGAESAFLTMCVNPRMLDADILNSKKADLPGYWQALEAIFLTLTVRADAEVRLSIQANPDKLPAWAKSPFSEATPASSLWRYFPERSLVTLASQTDFAGAGDALKLLMPEKDRQKLIGDLRGGSAAILPLDLFKDVMPNLGPDWGVCVLPAKDAHQLPQAMVALAVKPGSKKPAVDRALFQGVETLAGIVLLDFNSKHPDAIIRVQSVMQDKVEVKYLANDKLFPAGFQPACALKEGFLIFATSPDAIASFRLRETSPDVRKNETPILRVSGPALGKLLDQRRDHILNGLAEKQMSPQDAKKNLEDVIAMLGFFDHLTLSQRGGDGQATWIVRLAPAKK